MTGPAGATGPQGPIGLTGSAGATGAKGDTGAQGPAGQNGAAGPQGPAGNAGSNGVDGKNALVKTTTEAAGANCASGGTKVEAGQDANNNGVLDASEVNASLTRYVCNGAAGVAGPAGPQGATGVAGPQGPAGPSGSSGFVHYLGEQFGGGVVFHVYRDASGTERGLVVALTNQSEGTAWSNVSNSSAGATSFLNGLPNSNAIIAQAGHTNSAAKLCLDYEAGGFTDWYLPAKYELNLLYGNIYTVNKSLTSISGATEIFSTNNFGYYWSSSEYSTGVAWVLDDSGNLNNLLKDAAHQVRAVRAISVPSNSVTDSDGNIYETVAIGSQVWMKENLKTSKYRNGNPITTNLSDADWPFTTSGAYAIYNNDAANNTIYGKLYNWYAVADPRGLCPAGWHVPTDHDWQLLTKNLDPAADTTQDCSNTAGGKMKSTGTIQASTGLWQNPNTGATNSSGFTGLPGGSRSGSVSFNDVGTNGVWWSSRETTSSNAWYRYLLCYNGSSCRTNGGLDFKSNGFSVRCLRD